MVDVQLQTVDGSSIQKSSRPAILRYQSRSQRIMRVFAKALPLLVGLTEESQVITTKLIDDFMEQKVKESVCIHIEQYYSSLIIESSCQQG